MNDTDADYVSFFFDSPSSVPELETLEISHPSFSKPRLLVRNSTFGLAAQSETGEPAFFEYCPMILRPMADRGTLDYGISVTLGNYDEISDEIARAREAGTLAIRPTVKYRSYRGDRLNKPMFGPITLQAQSISIGASGAVFDAGAPSLNLVRTGERYSVDRFPMLLGFL